MSESGYLHADRGTYSISLTLQPVEEHIRVLMHIHIVSIPEHARVVAVEEDPCFWDALGQEVPRPEAALLVGPCHIGMVLAIEWIEAVDKDDAGVS